MVVWLRPYAFRQRLLVPVDELGVELVVEDDVATLSRRVR